MIDQWKNIIGFDKYQVSNTGKVRKKTSKRLLRPELNPSGYFVVTLYVDSKSKKRKLIHRLVASAFKPLSEFIGAEVNHINGIKTDNNHHNLEWVTRIDNMRHAFRTGLVKPQKCEHFMTRVVQISHTGEVINTFDSMTLASLATGAKNANISKVCMGQRRTAGGFIWKYAVR